jgi:hypothetical protein
MWLERTPNLNGGQSFQNNFSTEIDRLNAKIVSLEAQITQLVQVHSQGNIQNNDALDKLYIFTERLGLSGGTPKDSTFLDRYITDELIKRLGIIKTHLAELSGKATKDTESFWHQYSELLDYSNEGLEKRLGQIETHLAKLIRKDTRATKSSQRQRSESSTLNNKGLEKRLGQIEAYLAKLTRNSKAKSGRVHMATVDEQPDSDFSDNDASKSEDGDLNSDNSLAKSDSENHDINVHIFCGKKK